MFESSGAFGPEEQFAGRAYDLTISGGTIVTPLETIPTGWVAIRAGHIAQLGGAGDGPPASSLRQFRVSEDC